MKSYEMHYVGPGYPSRDEIEREAVKNGFTHSYWATEYGYNAFYNGDTIVVYNSTEDMPEDMKKDAEEYGKPIEATKICCICGKEIKGYGNNAWPIDRGRCCDDCNSNYVIPERIRQLFKKDSKE